MQRQIEFIKAKLTKEDNREEEQEYMKTKEKPRTDERETQV